MGVTKFDNLNAQGASARVVSDLPTTPEGYYGAASGDVDSVAWRGGEMAYLSTQDRLYIQTATSGRTATWKRLLETFVTTTSTSTSSSSTTTSSSTTSSSTTSSSSTTTSTSTSTSSSTSTSTSTSSTTTA